MAPCSLWTPRGQGPQTALGGGLWNTKSGPSGCRPEPCPGEGAATATPTLEQLPEEAGLLRTGSPRQAEASPIPPQPEAAAGLPEEAGLLRTGSPGQAEAPPDPTPARGGSGVTHIQLHQGEQVLCGSSEDGVCLLAGNRFIQGTVRVGEDSRWGLCNNHILLGLEKNTGSVIRRVQVASQPGT